MRPQKLKSLAYQSDGATIVEFAAIVSPLIILLLGALDLGYQAYATAVVQGTVNAAARQATLEGATGATVETYVRNRLSGIARGSNIQITASNFLTYNKIGKPEKLTTDVNSNGLYDKSGPDCFIDDNRNGVYDVASQGASGIGSAEDVVRYQVSVTYNRLSPVPQFAGLGNSVTISRSTFMRNEPYAGVVDPPQKCGV